MSTAIYYHADCLRHTGTHGHAEQPERLGAVMAAIGREPLLRDLPVLTPQPASHAALVRAHSARYVDQLFKMVPRTGRVLIDEDTSLNPWSLDAARGAAGAVIDASRRVLADNGQAFCVVRPPGHHAERERAMGFCLFNSIAAAALAALDEGGAERIAIVDFDVHHGNGTEDIFRDDPRVLFCSSYQYPLYPNINTPSVAGSLVNVPLPAGSDGAVLRDAVSARWLPELRAFRPDLILVSAGFDGHRDDPLAQLELDVVHFALLGRMLADLADELCDGRLVACLEGGYNLDALGRSAAAFGREIVGGG